MTKLNYGVIGVGYLGRFHAQRIKKLEDVTLVGVSDLNPEACQTVAHELHVKAYPHYEDLLPNVDAVSIAASTKSHYALAKACLSQGIHVLLEKPMTETISEANELIKIAHDKNVILQVGHLERFNSARLAATPHITQPLFIDATRLAPFNPRGADVNVILDLMIHDIDLILDLVKSPIQSIDANGAAILSSAIDIANARITFKNHCVANLTASRVSFKAERKMRIFQNQAYLSLDFHAKQLAVFKKSQELNELGHPEIIRVDSTPATDDALFEEIKSFTQAIITHQPPKVSGEQARDALIVAERITHLIQQTFEHAHDGY